MYLCFTLAAATQLLTVSYKSSDLVTEISLKELVQRDTINTNVNLTATLQVSH